MTIYDPCANPEHVKKEYSLASQRSLPNKKYGAIVLTISHAEFKYLDLKSLKKEQSVVYNVKNIFNPKEVNKSL
jgi:UDP-N-acetyl-D-galactosamine dehydrogenase